MKSRILLAIAAMLVVALPSGARPLATITENGHEILASMLTLPSTDSGTLSIQGCTACTRQVMTLSPDARFFVGRHEVTYGELKNVLATYPKSSVLVVTPVGTTVVTRIKVGAVIASDAR
jgi:hypothetical protein